MISTLSIWIQSCVNWMRRLPGLPLLSAVDWRVHYHMVAKPPPDHPTLKTTTAHYTVIHLRRLQQLTAHGAPILLDRLKAAPSTGPTVMIASTRTASITGLDSSNPTGSPSIPNQSIPSHLGSFDDPSYSLTIRIFVARKQQRSYY